MYLKLSFLLSFFKSIDQSFLHNFYHLGVWIVFSLVLGILYFFSFGWSLFLLYIILILLIFFLSFCFFKYNYLGLFSLLILLSFVIGLGLAYLRSPSYEESLHREGKHYISGNIEMIRPSVVGSKKKHVLVMLSSVCSDSLELRYKRAGVYCDESFIKNFDYGDRVLFCVFLFKDHGPLLPFSHDFRFYKHLHKIDFYLNGVCPPELVSKVTVKSCLDLLGELRLFYYRNIKKYVTHDNANFISSLVLGESRGLHKDIMQDMRYAGVSHVLCVSGLHLTLVSFISFYVFRFLFNSISIIALSCHVKTLSAVFAWIISCFYWILSGMNVATSRAFIMTSVTLLGVVISKNVNALRSLSIAMLIIVLLNPLQVKSLSFQLSFSAVIALVGGYSFFMNSIYIRRKGVISSTLNFFSGNIYSSLAVSIFTAPIAIYHFYYFSTYQVLGNLLVVPIIAMFLMPLAIICLFLIPLDLGGFCMRLMSLGVDYVMFIASYLSSLPGSSYFYGYISWFNCVLYLLSFCVFLLWKGMARYFGLLIFFLALILGFCYEKPVLILDTKRVLIGVNSDGKLRIYGKHASKFLLNYWSNWFGQKNYIYKKADLFDVNFCFSTLNNKRVLLMNRVCDVDNSVDLVLNNVNNYKFPKISTINKSELESCSKLVVYSKSSYWKVVGINSTLKIPYLMH